MTKQPEPIKNPLKKHLPRDILEEMKKINREDAKSYLDKRWGRNQEPEKKEVPEDQISQEEFDQSIKEAKDAK